MRVTDLKLAGLKLVEVPVYRDERGFFTERFRLDRFREAGIPADEFIQDNFSRSSHKVLRGLHFQYDQPQGKMLTVISGRIYDVVVDIRQNSPTFGEWAGVELSGDQPSWFWVPPGFAHGFVVLSPEGADVIYKVTAGYNPKGEGGILWNDPDLKVEWPIKDPSISPRDEKLLSWKEYQQQVRF
jgi:dTDP-4-dehydrorhamnose 3,5-epimerase